MRPPHRPPNGLPDLAFSRRDVVGWISDDQLAAGGYERLTRGAYRVRRTDAGPPTVAERVAAFLAVLPERAVLVGRSAAWAAGAWTPWPDDPVEVAVHPPGSVRRRAGLVVSGRHVPEPDIVTCRGMRCTSASRTALDAARAPGMPQATVPLVDAVLRRAGLRPCDVLAALDAAPPTSGDRRARRALALADPAAESARESEVRVMVVLAGLPAPVPQHAIDPAALRSVGYRRGIRLDLAWPARKVALEYDGDDAHAGRRSLDLARHNALRALGWTVIQIDAAGFRHPQTYLAQLAALLA